MKCAEAAWKFAAANGQCRSLQTQVPRGQALWPHPRSIREAHRFQPPIAEMSRSRRAKRITSSCCFYPSPSFHPSPNYTHRRDVEKQESEKKYFELPFYPSPSHHQSLNHPTVRVHGDDCVGHRLDCCSMPTSTLKQARGRPQRNQHIEPPEHQNIKHGLYYPSPIAKAEVEERPSQSS